MVVKKSLGSDWLKSLNMKEAGESQQKAKSGKRKKGLEKDEACKSSTRRERKAGA